ncbi:MAG: glutathione S-transferase family protein [Phenylobacterium sp.]|uniref:glutathione S-transferase family protein n=1 Tax=Phenylobacterium sp. TaxID=1871053 RepID=UPI00271B3F94|nr:glutathione S-transferase family protein [Phenylobacterium sp.]MDO8410205.1 glutathione S-transferase family protein [Phenylobacterium sp.]
MTDAPYILYGLPHSLYTGPARAYLRKQGITFAERSPRAPEYRAQVMPAIGRSIIPVLVTPQGEIVQDSVDIIDHFERVGPALSAYPESPRQRFLAHLFQLFGSQGLLRTAMHYRWSYYDVQAAFLDHAFGVSGAQDDPSRGAMRKMQSYLPGLGVRPDTIPLIEQGYGDLLAALEAHLSVHPYLFGGRPSIGDYGLFGPLFAHLGRDPVPADLMKRLAPAVFRWIERLHAPDLDIPDMPEAEGWLAGDAALDTLEGLVAEMGAEMGAELGAKLAALEDHYQRLAPVDGDPVSAKPHQRTIGQAAGRYRGVPDEVGVQPYLLYMVQRTEAALGALSAEDRRWADDLLARNGLSAIGTPRQARVDRRHHIEVWARP